MPERGMIVTVAMATLLAACPGKGGQGGAGSGSAGGGGGGTGPAATNCEGLRPKVEQMYRAEAQVKEPKRVEEAVADNTTMVMNDCARSPEQVVACVNGVSTVADLESKCLSPLDEEGSEGELLKQ